MSRHHHTKPRCPRCQLQQLHCICAQLPGIGCPIPVTVVQHWKESLKPTSTGSLLANILQHCRRKLHGHRDHPFDPIGLDGPDTWLVFPSRDGPVQTPIAPPRHLVLVDGNWNQASRMARRIPSIARLPRLELTIPERPVARLRQPPEPGARSTIEAAAAALRQCGWPLVADQLEQAHDRFVHATLVQRGLRPQVSKPLS